VDGKKTTIDRTRRLSASSSELDDVVGTVREKHVALSRIQLRIARLDPVSVGLLVLVNVAAVIVDPLNPDDVKEDSA
jgi:hypothetical protein